MGGPTKDTCYVQITIIMLCWNNHFRITTCTLCSNFFRITTGVKSRTVVSFLTILWVTTESCSLRIVLKGKHEDSNISHQDWNSQKRFSNLPCQMQNRTPQEHLIEKKYLTYFVTNPTFNLPYVTKNQVSISNQLKLKTELPHRIKTQRQKHPG